MDWGKNKKLGVLLSTPPDHPSVQHVSQLCQIALEAQVTVYLYLIDQGVQNLRDPRLLALSKNGVKFFVCAYGCQQHGVSTKELPSEISLCGLVVLSNIINGCDRFLSFN